MLELFILLFLFVTFSFGFLFGWHQREKWAKKKVDYLMEQLNTSLDEQINESQIQIKIEKHNGVLYVFNKDKDEFMAQGATREELEGALKLKYPDKVFLASTENLKEVNFNG